MPFRDPDQARDYQREYRRTRRSGDACTTPSTTPIPLAFRLQTARDVIDLLEQQVGAVLGDAALGTVERARTLGYLAGVSLKAIECGTLAARLEMLETVLKQRENEGEGVSDRRSKRRHDRLDDQRLGDGTPDAVRGAELVWTIEEFHCGLKQFTGVERCFVRSARGQRNHISCALRAFVRLEYHRFTSGISWLEVQMSIIRGAFRVDLANPRYRLHNTASA